MDSVREVVKWVIALRIQGQTRLPQRIWREDWLKGEVTMFSSRYCSSCPRSLLVPLSFLWSIDILIAGSSSFHHVLTRQLLECGWSKAAESLSFCGALTSQLPEWLEQGSASFMGEGHCFWNQPLRFLGSWTAFQVSSSQEVTAFLTLVWWIQGMTPITLSAVGVVRMTVWGPVQTGWSSSFLQSLTHPSSPGW